MYIRKKQYQDDLITPLFPEEAQGAQGWDDMV